MRIQIIAAIFYGLSVSISQAQPLPPGYVKGVYDNVQGFHKYCIQNEISEREASSCRFYVHALDEGITGYNNYTDGPKDVFCKTKYIDPDKVQEGFKNYILLMKETEYEAWNDNLETSLALILYFRDVLYPCK